MPELPEVETIRRQLEPRIRGRTLADATVLDPLWCAPVEPRSVEEAIRGRRAIRLDRRGKYLVLELEGERFLVMHLRMTGNLIWLPESANPPPYLRFKLELDGGEQVVSCDLRRFGTGKVIDGRRAVEDYLDTRVGVEPLDRSFTPDVLKRLAAGRRAPVKAFLLDQRRIAGIGNIYADEALFRACVHPLKRAGALRRLEIERLHEGIIETLEAGIESFGASIDRYRDADGARGEMQDRFLIHRREGMPCPRCGSPVVKLRAAGRGTYVCPRCQRAPRRRKVSPAASPAKAP